jgi:sulfhydrogenase subunit beta (sulfur reductase)
MRCRKAGMLCGERGIDRNSSTQCDIFLEDKGDYYLADIITPAGKSIIDGFMPGSGEAGHSGAGVSGTDSSGYPAGGAQVVDDNILQLDMDENVLFNYDIWEKVSETCLGCGTCTYICPTCHCFGFRDTAVKGEASRYRYWDSCMYPKFTLHASGHNPRSTRKERFRQRVMHKYVYIKNNFGLTACTGCGRCIRSCPAGINIRSVVKSIMQEVSK